MEGDSTFRPERKTSQTIEVYDDDDNDFTEVQLVLSMTLISQLQSICSIYCMNKLKENLFFSFNENDVYHYSLRVTNNYIPNIHT